MDDDTRAPGSVWVYPEGNLTAVEDTQIPLSEIFAEVDKMMASFTHRGAVGYDD